MHHYYLDSSNLESHSVTSVHVEYCRLPLCNEAYNILKSRCFLHIIIFDSSILNHIKLPLLMLNKVVLPYDDSFRLPLSNQAYNMLKSGGELIIFTLFNMNRCN